MFQQNKNLSGMKMYTSLEQLGLTSDTDISSITSAMKDNSIALIDVPADSGLGNTIGVATGGSIQIWKTNSWRITGFLIPYNGRQFAVLITYAGGIPKFSDWITFTVSV